MIRPVQQARSQQTLELLLDSAEALIADKGFDDVTVVEPLVGDPMKVVYDDPEEHDKFYRLFGKIVVLV